MLAMMTWLAACGTPAAPEAPVASAPAAAPTPETPPPPPTPAPPAACSLVGSWTATLPAGPQPWNGKTYPGEFKADGTFDAETPMGHRSAAWAFDGSVLTIDHGTGEGRGVCKPADVGHYTLALAPDCNSFTGTLVDDACDGRKNGMNGVMFARK
jgi:hypothetical protein